jgi:hypothetical protein
MPGGAGRLAVVLAAFLDPAVVQKPPVRSDDMIGFAVRLAQLFQPFLEQLNRHQMRQEPGLPVLQESLRYSRVTVFSAIHGIRRAPGNAWTASAPGPGSWTRCPRRRAVRGTLGHMLVDKPADGLAVFDDEGHVVRPHFQNRARADTTGARMAEAWIEETGIMHPELADQRVEGHHLGGIVRRHVHRLLADQYVEGVWVKDQFSVVTAVDRFPEIEWVLCADQINIDQAGMLLGAVTDQAARPSPSRSMDSCTPPPMRSLPPLIRVSDLWMPSRSASGISDCPRRKRIWLRREPERTRIGKVSGEISA